MKRLALCSLPVCSPPWRSRNRSNMCRLAHPVQDFLDRLGVRGVLPLESMVVRPIERREAARLLDSAFTHSDRLSSWNGRHWRNSAWSLPRTSGHVQDRMLYSLDRTIRSTG